MDNSGDKWDRVRQIVREECERIEQRILEVLEKHGQKTKLGFANGRWTGVTSEQLEAWKAAYGAVNIEEELKKAAAWIVSNPHLAPKSQLGRFLNTWFARTQNQLSIRSIPTRSEVDKPRLCAYCGVPAMGSVNGYKYCRAHFDNALADEEPRKFMAGVTAKPVSGS